jgi:hypothetical protein
LQTIAEYHSVGPICVVLIELGIEDVIADGAERVIDELDEPRCQYGLELCRPCGA